MSAQLNNLSTRTNQTTVGNADGSGAMFDKIAKRYDLMNRLISFGLDKLWRAKLLRALGSLVAGDTVLDVASGTADVALSICHKKQGVRVKGLDPSAGMLDVGKVKAERAGLTDRVELVVGDAQAMPFQDDAFAASCISFGIRNVPDRLLGLQEMRRTTRPGGRVVILELSEPQGGLFAPLARFHIHHLVPWLGSILSGSKEYRYLQASIAAFPGPKAFGALMEEAGLKNVEIHPMTFGVAHLYVGHVE
jgi:demethylmenaquinone methyltransferase / 2-methoxy-6-polyprenyl-1,4-benzoquinol methylase